MAGKLFLEKLLLKLKTGNSRSIHLNALPGRYARLDLHELINIWQGLHLRFIQDLLTKPKFRFTISVDPKHLQSKSDEEIIAIKKLVTRLNGLYYQQQDEFLEHGTQTFALGYPLLIKRDAKQPGKILKAPIAIWYLHLQKDLHKSNTWTISRHEDSPVLFNEVLRAHIETNDRIKLDDLLAHFDEDLFTEEKLSGVCRHLLEKLGTTSTSIDLEVKILPGTNKESIEKITADTPWIRWSGIFGLYRTQKQSIIKDMEQFVRDPDLLAVQEETETPAPSAELPVVLPAVETDPSQEFILTSLNHKNNLIIQGPPGTGKSQSLSAIITDALYHKKTCLVVCEKKTALDVIYANLSQAGLSELCVIIEDVHRDRGKVVERVRQLLDARDENPDQTFRQHEFMDLKERYINLRHDSSQYLTNVNTICFGDDCISDLVARIRKLEDERDIGTINGDHSILFPGAKYESFNTLMKMVEEGARLFEPLGAILPFDDLNDNLFASDHTKDIFPDIHEAKDLLKELISSHSTAIAEYGAQYADLSGRNKWKTKFAAFFSGKWKNIASVRVSTLQSYSLLQEFWKDKRYLNIDLPPIEESGTLEAIGPPLEVLSNQLKRLLPDQGKFVSYASWRKFRDSKDDQTAILLQALASTVPVENWQSTFTHAYLTEFIRQFKSENSLENDFSGKLNDLRKNGDDLLQLLGKKLLLTWQEKQREVFRKRTISTVKQLYNLRRNKTYGRRNSLRKMIHEDTELFSTAYPVVLVSPVVCSSIFPLKEGLFDHVIFDEASQLRLEDTFAALFRGKKKIISGDKHQMPPSGYFMQNMVLMDDDDQDETTGASDDFLAESNSLLEYGTDTDFKSVFLDFHYRSRHPDLIAFSNAAFYGNRLVPMPAMKNGHDKALEFHPVNGIYRKNRTNREEAEAIAQYIYEVIPSTCKQVPSVGIATFNINQRNLIWDLLTELTIDDPVKAGVLDGLLEKGLFVKNLENIQGDERDIVLISTTFGANEEGKFRQQFGPVSRLEGYRLLNVIITRARNKMAVFTSIPSGIRSGFTSALQEKGNSGNTTFFSWLAFVEAASNQDRERKDSILGLMDEHCIEKPFLHESKRMPLFHQQIYGALREIFGKDQVAHNFKFGGFLLDLAIVKDGRPVVSIATNHMKQQTSTSYKLFVFKSKMLEQHGVRPYVADVLGWHQNWDGEFNKLVGFISLALE
ncbi:MAG: hypothetical protein GY751_18400 [Bacteroidetes bacterium]|nr:hypothetical protein [Bacteroidota bacterium]